jgi:hypothetical protein
MRLLPEDTMIIKALGVGVAASVALAALTATPDARQTSGDKLSISAFAVNMSNIASGGTAVVDIQITRWSTAEERAQIINTMIEKGPQALLSALQKMPVHGRWRIPGLVGPDPHELRLGHDLHYAWQTALPDGGRRIVIATDRYIGFQEARNQPRTIDYPFTLIQIQANKNGEGEGRMAVATKIDFNKQKNTIELENYSSEPVRLQNIKIKPA